MSQLILDPVLSGYNLAKVNDNFKRIEEAFNTLLLHKDGSKALTSDLDVNSQKLLNVGGIEIGGVDLLESITSLQEAYNAYVSELEVYKRAVEGILDEAISYGAVDKKSIGNAQAVFTTNQAYAKNSNLTLPLKYIVGKNTLRLSLGHTYLLYKGVDYEEVGVVGEESQTIKIIRASGIGAGATIEQVVDGDNDLIEIFENAQSLYTLLTTNYSPTKVEEFINSVSDAKELRIEDKISELWDIYNNLSALQTSFANTVADINTKYSTITDMYEDVSTKYSVLETLYPQLVALITDTNFDLDGLNAAVANILSAIQDLQALTPTIESNAQTASTAAASASTSAETSSNNATIASNSATKAQIWAEGTDTEVEGILGEHSSKGWAEEAKRYASSASNSSSDSQTHAALAETYASNAANSASAAQAAQTAAQSIVDMYKEASDEAGRLVASADQIVTEYQNSAADIATMVEGSDEEIAIRELNIQHSAKTWAQLIEESAGEFAGFKVSDYYKKTEVDSALADKATITALSAETAARQSADSTNAANITNLSATVSGLENTKQDTLTFDNAPTANSSNPVTSGGVKTALDAKQDSLTFDSTPTANSSNPVTSAGIKTAIEAAVANIAVDDTVTDSSSNPVKSSGIFSHVKACVPKSIGSGTKPVYSNANGVITESGSNVGNITRPICMVSGTLTQCTHTLEKSVPSDAEFLPSQTGHAGEYLKTDGETASWSNVESLPSQTGNAGKVLTTDGTSASWSEPLSGRQILETFYTFRTDVGPINGAYDANGTVYNRSDFSGGQNPYDLLVAGKAKSCSFAEYETQLSTYGSCGLFGLDTETQRFRVPTLKNILEPTVLSSAIGQIVEAGLPNIAGEFNAYSWGNAENAPTGAFKQVSSVLMNSISSGDSVASRRIGLDAASSSSIYGNSNTVQPQTIKVRPMVQLATAGQEISIEQYEQQLSDYARTNTLNGRLIGEIIQSALPLTDAGVHLLDGSQIQNSGIYAQFCTYVANLQADYPDLFCTEAEFTASVEAYGNCGKFVNGASYIRLPKVSDILQGTTDVTAVGDLIEAGLPNITGYFGSEIITCYDSNDSGAITSKALGSSKLRDSTSSSIYGRKGLYINASLSSPIYGKSTTVQPQTIKALLYICVANSVKTQIQVDIDNIATDLNGVERVVSSGTDYVRYESGLQICWGEGKANNSFVKVTLPKAFKDTNYSVAVAASSRVNAAGFPESATAVSIGTTNNENTNIRFICVGLWK